MNYREYFRANNIERKGEKIAKQIIATNDVAWTKLTWIRINGGEKTVR